MPKILASDIDGTLYVNGEVPQSNIDAVREFRAAGNLFVLCTGRSPESSFRFLSEHPSLECDGIILAGGGGLYRNTEKGWAAIEQQFMNNAAALQLIAYAGDSCPNFTVHWSDGTRNYGLPGRVTERHKAHPPIAVTLPQWEALNKPMLIAVFSSMQEDETQTIAFRDEVRRRWGDALEAHHNTYYLDVSAKGCSKEWGFTRMVQLLGGAPAYAVGDGFNDAPMFKGAGKEYSFLIQSGAQDLLPLVQRSVPSVAECINILLNQ